MTSNLRSICLKFSKITAIVEREVEPVYDIHHRIPPENFHASHPNLILEGKVVSNCGRHAGGVIIADGKDLEGSMPIISVKTELQTPWTEGMNFRNLEDNGFIKYDFLGLTLMEDIRHCIERVLFKQGNKRPSFSDVKQFFDAHLNCRFNKLNDDKVFATIYRSGKWFPGIFQFTACVLGNTSVTLANGTKCCIKDIKVGDRVISYDDAKQQFVTDEVVDVIDNGVRECVELEFSNGSTIKCTPDHLFMTANRGWVRADDLTDDDDVVEGVG